MDRQHRLLPLGLLLLAVFSSASLAAPTCPSYIVSQPKGNTLYLYFPTASDNSFPNYDGAIGTGTTSPLAVFDVADLDSGIGTTAQLRSRIFDLVVDDYCEFNLDVNSPTTTAPSPTESRWQIVGLGTDSATGSTGGALFGLAQSVDTNDADAQDNARVWANSFDDAFGAAGGALDGTNSTLERWATAIGETTAHEAAHNYGAAHGHSAPRAGSAEDEQNNHIMATGSTGLTGEIRASRDRHFSDTEYGILAHNIGLNIKTLHNWDFVNPNDTSANAMRIKILSTAATLTIGWWYNGTSSPWQNPTITATGTTQAFQGTTYNVFDLDFSTAKSWSGPTAGVVDAGAEFHTGASFNQNDPVIVWEVKLRNGGTNLPLSPRLPAYDIGTADVDSGDFDITFFNTSPAEGDLLISNVEIVRLPRMLDINAMMADGRPLDIRGLPVDLSESRRVERINVANRSKLSIGRLTDKRAIDIVYGPKDCPPGSVGSGTPRPGRAPGVGDAETGEVTYCLKGNALSLFPATYTYIMATVTQPNARHWDRAQNRFVDGPVQSKLFYQVAGIVPDLNNNGIDDLIDVRTGTSVDDNKNGVVDEAEPRTSRCPCNFERINWLLTLLVVGVVLILLLFLIGLLRRR